MKTTFFTGRLAVLLLVVFALSSCDLWYQVFDPPFVGKWETSTTGFVVHWTLTRDKIEQGMVFIAPARRGPLTFTTDTLTFQFTEMQDLATGAWVPDTIDEPGWTIMAWRMDGGKLITVPQASPMEIIWTRSQ